MIGSGWSQEMCFGNGRFGDVCTARVIWQSLSVFCLLLIFLAPTPANSESDDASGDHASIGLFVSSDGNRCFAPGTVQAIKYFASEYVDTLNENGGINGRRLVVNIYDDFEDGSATVSHIKNAIADQSMIALIGVPSSTRGKQVFDAAGDEIKKTSIPFVTEISVDNIFAQHPSVYTMARSVRNELEVVREFIKNGNYQRPVFVGLGDDLYSKSLGDGLEGTSSVPLAGRYVAPVKDYSLEPEDIRGIVAEIAANQPDIILLAIHSSPSATLLKELHAAGISAPVMILLGRVSSVARKLGEESFEGAISQIAREGVPNVYSERLRQRIWRAPNKTWIFEDTKNSQAPGWQTGQCKPRADVQPRRLFDAANRRAVGRGTQYSDMLRLVTDIAKLAPARASPIELRRFISSKLPGYTEGKRVLEGLWQDWTFTKDRTAAGDVLILTKSAADPAVVLGPLQFRRVNSTLVPIPTVYTTIDLISLSRIDTNDRSFDAEFFLSLKSARNDIDIRSMEFTNAYRSQTGQGTLLKYIEIHNGRSGTNFPDGVRVYRVSGKFNFHPELSNYPFDTQRLSVSFQSRNTKQAFFIQPPSQNSFQRNVFVDGWTLSEQYVGSEQDIIPTFAKNFNERRIMPFYKFNVTWVTDRISFDYYLRVIAPLAFILLVTYFSVFLPHARFDSMMAIQVTALLSSIALYLALPKVDSDQATLSDKIFMMTYAAVSLMIGLSVLKDNILDGKSAWLIPVISFLQKVLFPISTIYLTAYLMSRMPGIFSAPIGFIEDTWSSFLRILG